MAWEIGNEPGIRSESNEAMTPSEYAAYYDIVAGAIRATDPKSTIVLGNVSGDKSAFIIMVMSNVTVKPDAIGMHPYGISKRDYAPIVNALARHYGIPVWFTEYGRQGGNGMGSVQSLDLGNYFMAARGVVPVAVWFCLSDRSADGGETFGLFDASGTLRQACATLKLLA